MECTTRRPGWDPGFTPQDLAALVSVTDGPVLLAGSPGLDHELCRHGGSPDVAPAVAVGAADAADVVAAVRFAADFALPVAVLSPGHGVRHAVKEGVLVTTARLDRIHLDRRSRTAVVGAGALWSDVVARAAELALAPLAPPCPGAGVVGPDHGWGAGHVQAIEYVTPDAQLRRVTPVTDRRLFARLCAADPADTGLGIVTEMTFALFRYLSDEFEFV